MGKILLIGIFALTIASGFWLFQNTHIKEIYVSIVGGSAGERYFSVDAPHDDKEALHFDLVDPECAPEDMLNKIMYGYHLMLDTKKNAPKYVVSNIDCNCCHFNGGNTLGGKNRGISLVGVTAMYPKYSKRDKKNITLGDRISNCFMRSLNGIAPAKDSIQMESLIAYFAWISHEVMDAPMLPWLGLDDVPTKHVANAENGEKVYEKHCTICHGVDGNGNVGVPPVFGPHSFNDGAGMNTLPMLSSFVWQNMPHGQPVLSPEEALDVAAYVISRPRPHFVPPHKK